MDCKGNLSEMRGIGYLQEGEWSKRLSENALPKPAD